MYIKQSLHNAKNTIYSPIQRWEMEQKHYFFKGEKWNKSIILIYTGVIKQKTSALHLGTPYTF